MKICKIILLIPSNCLMCGLVNKCRFFLTMSLIEFLISVTYQFFKERKNLHYMYKLIASVFAILTTILLSSCNYNEFSNIEYVSNTEHLENVIEITNKLNEQYSVEYEERNGFPSQRMKINIFESDKLIISYWSKFDSNYIPNKILYLFTDNNYDYCFIANDTHEYIVRCVIDNERYDPLIIDVDWTEVEYMDSYTALSETMQRNIDESELIERFEICDYDYDAIIKLYNLSS